MPFSLKKRLWSKKDKVESRKRVREEATKENSGGGGRDQRESSLTGMHKV